MANFDIANSHRLRHYWLHPPGSAKFGIPLLASGFMAPSDPRSHMFLLRSTMSYSYVGLDPTVILVANSMFGECSGLNLPKSTWMGPFRPPVVVGARNHRRSCSQTERFSARIICQRRAARAHILRHCARQQRFLLTLTANEQNRLKSHGNVCWGCT